MIKIKDSNGNIHNVIRLMKDGHEILKSYENDRLIYSPYIIMGTIYSGTSFTLTSTNTPNVTATFEILGEAGTDTDGTYYNFGMRLPDRADNDALYSQSHFSNVLNNIFIQLNALNILRSVDLYSTPFFYLGVINRLVDDRHNTKFKEIDFKDFNVQNVTLFQPCTFAPALTTIRNMDKLDFKQDVSWKEGFRYLQNVDTFICGSKSLYHIKSLEQAFQESSGLSLINFAMQDQDNTVCTSLNNTFKDCTNVNRIDIANLRLVNLTNANAAFRNCYNLYHNPLGGLPTGGITQWQNTYEGCRTLLGSQFDTNDYSGAVNMAACFKGCTGITSLDLSTKNLSNCANFDSTWAECTQLSSLSLPSIKPMYMQGSFRATALYNIPANIDFSECLNTDSMCGACENFEGAMDYSNLDFSAVTQSGSMFTSCKNVYSFTFAQGAFHNSTHMNSMFERCTSLTSVTNLDMTSLTTISSTFYLDGELLQVTGTKPTGVVSVQWFLYGCSKLQRFIDMSNLKVKDNTQFGVGSLPALNNDLHIETWTNEAGTGKPVVWMGQNHGFPTILTEDLAHEYNIDPQGWTFLSKQGTTNNNAFLRFSNCKYPIINLDKIKVRVMNDSSNNVVPIRLESAFAYSKITEIDTTNWLDNTDVPSLTRLPIYSNQNMFDQCKWLTKIVIRNLDYIESSNSASYGNNKVFDSCSGVTSFTCEYQFFDIVRNQTLDLHYMTQWVNPTEIEAFFNQLTTVTSKQYTATGNNFRFNLSSQTKAVFQGLANYSTIYAAMLSHGWEIV